MWNYITVVSLHHYNTCSAWFLDINLFPKTSNKISCLWRIRSMISVLKIYNIYIAIATRYKRNLLTGENIDRFEIFIDIWRMHNLKINSLGQTTSPLRRLLIRDYKCRACSKRRGRVWPHETAIPTSAAFFLWNRYAGVTLIYFFLSSAVIDFTMVLALVLLS